jgi:hypothetical protein
MTPRLNARPKPLRRRSKRSGIPCPENSGAEIIGGPEEIHNAEKQMFLGFDMDVPDEQDGK